jgi:hypothetical protein
LDSRNRNENKQGDTSMKTALFAAGLILAGSPAFASTEVPISGSANVLTSPSYTTAGSEGAPVFLPAGPDMTLAISTTQRLPPNAKPR